MVKKIIVNIVISWMLMVTYNPLYPVSTADGQYLTDIYHNNSIATFVWNGFIWKTNIDVDANGQLNAANNA